MTLLVPLGAVVLLFLASATVLLLMTGPTLLLKPRRRSAEFYRALGQPTTPGEARLEYEEIGVEVETGLKLDCWLIKADAPVKGTVLYLHGVSDCKIDGLRLARLLHDDHFNVFLYDSRRHGRSGGKFCTYGFYEKFDVVKIIDYLAQRKDVAAGKIAAFGTSMGAAVAIQAAAIDVRIGAVIAENSFATLRSIFDDYQKRMFKLPFHYLRNLVIVRSERIARFKASDVSPLEAVRTLEIPILFIYGTNDHLIDHEYSVMLYENTRGKKDLFPVEHASHNDTWKVAGRSYETKVLGFLERNLA
jgi:pimeloyl-ACP methyl ester carboxylesterase